MEISKIDKLLVVVNSGMDKPYNQYASYAIAFTAKKVHNIPNVTIFYGPQGVEMVKKGNLAKLSCSDDLKKLIASQFEGLSPDDLPDNLEQMARYLKENLGVVIASCATMHVAQGFATSIDDTTNIEDFVMPLGIPDVTAAALSADKILYF